MSQSIAERIGRIEEKLDIALKHLEKTKCEVHTAEIKSLQGNIKWVRNLIIGWMSLITSGILSLFVKNLFP